MASALTRRALDDPVCAAGDAAGRRIGDVMLMLLLLSLLRLVELAAALVLRVWLGLPAPVSPLVPDCRAEAKSCDAFCDAACCCENASNASSAASAMANSSGECDRSVRWTAALFTDAVAASGMSML